MSEIAHERRATIVVGAHPKAGNEPYAQLEDGRVMPMHYNRGQDLEPGTTGVARYIYTHSSGLWQFTPDPDQPASRADLIAGLRRAGMAASWARTALTDPLAVDETIDPEWKVELETEDYVVAKLDEICNLSIDLTGEGPWEEAA